MAAIQWGWWVVGDGCLVITFYYLLYTHTQNTHTYARTAVVRSLSRYSSYPHRRRTGKSRTDFMQLTRTYKVRVLWRKLYLCHIASHSL